MKNNQKKRCAILLNSHRYPPNVEQLLNNADLVIATDGAFTDKYSIDLVIGDMDSVDKDTLGATKTIHIADQNSSDAEKAINYAIKHGYSAIDLIGIQGDRLDHSLFHLQLMQNYYDYFSESVAYTETERCWIAPDDQKIYGTVGQRISLINLSNSTLFLHTQGLHWQVKELTRHSLSNRFAEELVIIKPTLIAKNLLIILQLNNC